MICVRTETMADGYWNDPALTAATFVNGWYHTADIGFIPEPGRVERVVARYVRSFHLFPLPSFPRTETAKVRRGEIEAAFRRHRK